jgi:ribonuclease HI
MDRKTGHGLDRWISSGKWPSQVCNSMARSQGTLDRTHDTHGYEEIFDAELEAIGQAMRRFAQRNKTDRHYTIFSDSQSAFRRCSNDRPGPGQAQAREIIDGEKVLKLNNCTVTLRWVPGHGGVPGNEQADAMAKKAAKGPPKDAYARRVTKTASKTYLTRKATETRTKSTKDGSKPVRPKARHISRESKSD